MVKNLLDNGGDIRDVDLIPGLGRSPGDGHGNPLLFSSLENFLQTEGLNGLQSIGSQRVRHD